MAPIEITKYTYHFFSSREEDVGVLLYDAHDDLVATVRFLDGSDPLPAATRAKGRHTLFLRRSTLADVVDMLRNEGPVYLWWAGGSDTRLSTEYEPVGEGESE